VDNDVLAFETAVERWIGDTACDDSVLSFDDLVRMLPGVYPTDVRAALKRLEHSGGLSVAALERLGRRSQREPVTAAAVGDLPVPHPLDYDWRFSPSAVDRLATECERRSNGTTVVLLGAPTVFWALRERGRVPALLLDANPAIVRSFARRGRYQARQCDLRADPLPDLTSSVVLLDPPWYGEHELLFLWAAAQLCTWGGTALASLPAHGTRPGVANETDTSLHAARRWGLKVEARERGALAYVSPPFERNALNAAGLDGIPGDWRRGDLVTLRATGSGVLDPPPRVTAAPWPEAAIGQVRFRLRIVNPVPFGRVRPQLKPIVSGDVLDSVSRRDPRREMVDVWTSGNRVFGCESPAALRWILLAAAAGEPPDAVLTAALGRPLTGSERSSIRITMDQIRTLVSTEKEELAAMGWAA
jgi:hypothetical protein